jgi:NADH-quinone oxidoreductase subunit K
MLPTGIPIEQYIYLSLLLFSIGAMGVLLRRNIIVLFMCIELMLNAVNLLLVAFSSYHTSTQAQVFVFFVMLVAAAEATVGLAIMVMLYRNNPTTEVDIWNRLRG